MASSATTYRAWNFAQSIGVNTHLSWQSAGSAYANAAIVESSLAYLGATHVRDGIPYAGWTLPEYVAIAATGVKFDITISGPTTSIGSDLSQIAGLDTSAPGSVASIEGANEFNNQAFSYNGVSSLNNPAWAKLFDPALYNAVKANAILSTTSVIASSMSNAGATQIQQEGNLSAFVDSANWHVYYGNGEQPAAELAAGVAQAQSTAPGKAVTITESGYYTAVDATDWGGGGVTQAVQATETVNILLDAFRDGVSTTYLYELMDNVANPASTDLEDSFGLFLADGTPKLAATAIHNLTSVLADTGATAASFTTGSLADTITGLPATGASMVMEKSNGTFDLVIWNEPTLWNQSTKSPVAAPTSAVTVNLGATYGLVKVYDPLVGAAAVQTLTNTATVNLALSSDPYIIEITPNPVSKTYSPGAAGGTIISLGADTVLAGAGAVRVTGDGPTIKVVGGSGALTYAGGTAVASITGGTGAMAVTLSTSGSMVTGGAGSMTVLDLAGGDVIQGAAGNASNGMTVTTTRGNSLITTGLSTATNVINLGSGNDTVIANGTSQVTGSTGNDAITVNGWWGTVTTGTGSSTVTMNANGAVTTNGRDVVHATGGLTVDANGPATTVTGGSGGMWFAGHGSATVTGGSGGGFFDMSQITRGVISTAAGATDTIQLGAQAAVVTARGTDLVRMGSGAATISALGGTVSVQGGAGAMNFIEGAANAAVTAGTGVDSFTLTKGQEGHSLTIQDFASSRDALHLIGYKAADVRTQVSGGTTQIMLSDNTHITLVGFTQTGWSPSLS